MKNIVIWGFLTVLVVLGITGFYTSATAQQPVSTWATNCSPVKVDLAVFGMLGQSSKVIPSSP